jgi:hypothetical protein
MLPPTTLDIGRATNVMLNGAPGMTVIVPVASVIAGLYSAWMNPLPVVPAVNTVDDPTCGAIEPILPCKVQMTTGFSMKLPSES